MSKTKKSSRRLNPNEKLLVELAYGGRIERRPARPFPPRYTSVIVKREYGQVTEEKKELSEARVLSMVNKGWIKGEPKDALWDQVDFRVTDAGKAHVTELMKQDAAEGEH